MNKENDEHAFDDVREDIQRLVSAVSDVIKEHPLLAAKNFGLFYQHGRLGYMDLDIMESRLKEELAKKNETEDQESIDTNEN